jgi:hypothetical protein
MTGEYVQCQRPSTAIGIPKQLMMIVSCLLRVYLFPVNLFRSGGKFFWRFPGVVDERYDSETLGRQVGVGLGGANDSNRGMKER